MYSLRNNTAVVLRALYFKNANIFAMQVRNNILLNTYNSLGNSTTKYCCNVNQYKAEYLVHCFKSQETHSSRKDNRRLLSFKLFNMERAVHQTIGWLIALICLTHIVSQQQVNASTMADSKEFMSGKVIRVAIIHVIN